MFASCGKPVDRLLKSRKVAIVAVHYNPSVYMLDGDLKLASDVPYSLFTGDPMQLKKHELILNEYLTDLMLRTSEVSDVRLVRPLKLVNTSLLYDDNATLHYEYLLDPYDPIDIQNRTFMAGLAQRLAVDAVAQIDISFGIQLDEKMLWDEFKDPHEQTIPSYRMQLYRGHKTSWLRTRVHITVIDQYASQIYNEVRFVDTASERVTITDNDLTFDGGVSPKLFQLGVADWLNDWANYLPERTIKE